MMVLETLLLEDNNVPGSQMTADHFTAGAAGIYKAEINIQAETAAGAERSVWLSMAGASLQYSQIRARYFYYPVPLTSVTFRIITVVK